jgi:hypothetical protein
VKAWREAEACQIGHWALIDFPVDGAPSESRSTTTILAQLSIEPHAGAGAVHIITLSCFTCQSSKCAIIHHNEINGLSEHHNGKMASNPAMPALLINPYHPTAASL